MNIVLKLYNNYNKNQGKSCKKNHEKYVKYVKLILFLKQFL